MILSLVMLFPCLKHYYLRLDRNNGVGLCSMVARIGGIVSPYVVLLVTIFFQYSLFYNILLCLNRIAIFFQCVFVQCSQLFSSFLGRSSKFEENIPVTCIRCCGPGCRYFGVLVTRNFNSTDATDRGASRGFGRGLQPLLLQKASGAGLSRSQRGGEGRRRCNFSIAYDCII